MKAADAVASSTAAQLAQTALRGRSRGSSDHLHLHVSDGISPPLTAISTSTSPPSITRPSLRAVSQCVREAGQSCSLQPVQATDADNDALTYYLVDNTPSPAAPLHIDGSPYAQTPRRHRRTTAQRHLSQPQHFRRSPRIAYTQGVLNAQLQRISRQRRRCRAVTSHAPVLTVPSQRFSTRGNHSASSLFGATDPHGDFLPITSTQHARCQQRHFMSMVVVRATPRPSPPHNCADHFRPSRALPMICSYRLHERVLNAKLQRIPRQRRRARQSRSRPHRALSQRFCYRAIDCASSLFSALPHAIFYLLPLHNTPSQQPTSFNSLPNANPSPPQLATTFPSRGHFHTPHDRHAARVLKPHSDFHFLYYTTHTRLDQSHSMRPSFDSLRYA